LEEAMNVVDAAPKKPGFAAMIFRDGWLLWSLMSMIVCWGIALLNIAGLSVSRGHSGSIRAGASDWAAMLVLAVIVSVIGAAVVLWRVQFWKRAQTTSALLLHIEPYGGNAQNGYALQYRYHVSGQNYQEKTTVGRNSLLAKAQTEDSFPVFFDPKKPSDSRVLV
jgi:hypothetical protein